MNMIEARMTIDERLEALTQNLELFALRQTDGEERHDREMEEIRREGRAMRADLRSAFVLSLREERNERRRRQELDARTGRQAERENHPARRSPIVDRRSGAEFVPHSGCLHRVHAARRKRQPAQPVVCRRQATMKGRCPNPSPPAQSWLTTASSPALARVAWVKSTSPRT